MLKNGEGLEGRLNNGGGFEKKKKKQTNVENKRVVGCLAWLVWG